MKTYRLIHDGVGNKEDAEEHGMITTGYSPEDAGSEYIEAACRADPCIAPEGIIFCYECPDGPVTELAYSIEMSPVFRVSKKS